MNSNRLALVVLALALAVVFGACASGRPPASTGPGSSPGGSGVEVTLDVFSGRPNPTWALSTDEERELARRLRNLPPSDKSPVDGNLGYRGFIITNPSQKPGLPSETTVANGVVTSHDETGVHHYIDATGIERWLIEQARKRGYGPLVESRPASPSR